jgi:hypothetical protein
MGDSQGPFEEALTSPFRLPEQALQQHAAAQASPLPSSRHAAPCMAACTPIHRGCMHVTGVESVGCEDAEVPMRISRACG